MNDSLLLAIYLSLRREKYSEEPSEKISMKGFWKIGAIITLLHIIGAFVFSFIVQLTVNYFWLDLFAGLFFGYFLVFSVLFFFLTIWLFFSYF